LDRELDLVMFRSRGEMKGIRALAPFCSSPARFSQRFAGVRIQDDAIFNASGVLGIGSNAEPRNSGYDGGDRYNRQVSRWTRSKVET